SPGKKIEIMHDQLTGAGGLVLGLMTILATAFCIAQLDQNFILQSLIVSEVSAKLGMVVIAWVGRSAREGTNTCFIEAMHGQYRKVRLIVALSISFGLALSLSCFAGFVAVIVGVVVALILVGISNRHFKGVTGDIFGAGNEIVRFTSLIAILIVLR
ncbi:MAG: adenosylcobinamide-GDP ribazoletransferase, partial [Candidatus Bathyarchaeota archaeon]